MAKKLAGLWNIEEGDNDNFNNYLKTVGVGIITRKAITYLKPSIKISIDEDGVWTVFTSSTFKNTTATFKIGIEHDEKTADGRNVKSKYSIDGNKLIKQEVATPPGVSSTITREITDDDKMILTLEAVVAAEEGQGDAKNVVCRRVYKRVEVAS